MEMMALHLLILEDNPNDAELAVKELEREGFDVKWTRVDTGKAFRKALAEKPDLVLVDYSLPSFNGPTAIEVHRQLDLEIPLIIVSGTIGEEIAVECMKYGATDYVLKDNLSRLGPVVKRALGEMKIYRKSKQAEDALRESEERYRVLFETAKDAIFVSDETGRFVDVNQAACEFLGYSREELLKLGPKEIDADPTGYDAFIKVRNGLTDKLTFEINQIKKDGTHLPVEITGSFFNEKGKQRALAIARDITERKKTEEEKKKLEARLHRAQKMEAIGKLAGGIAHRFNNALCVITGNLDLFEMNFPGNEKVTDYTREMKDSIRRMTRLTAQLLAYARGGKYQAKTISLRDFVRDTLLLVKHTIDSAISVDTDLPPRVCNVKADLTQMQMALSAVLINAAEAMDGKGQIRIACRNTMITDETAVDFPELKPGNYISLTITDDGKGMDEETRKRIFEPFFTTRFEGRGLGMAAAYGIVKNHDGWISVDSELGKGTIVKIYLPAVEAIVKEHSKPKTEPIKGRGTILIIEDEEMVMEMTRKILEMLGYSVLKAKTGQEAINVAKTFDDDIDLAMLDILLPDMSGNAIYPFLMKARPDLKVIVCSGYSADGPAQEILNAGAEDFIQKPFSISKLSEKLKKTLESEK
ncbi:MAG: response regulator [Deltaproteobacteria bacterium]|nr:response regulator [Deltaproteobacteria bacterium]